MTGFLRRTFGSHNPGYHLPGFYRSTPLRIAGAPARPGGSFLARCVPHLRLQGTPPHSNQTLPFQPAGFSRGSAIGRLVAVTAQSYFGIPSQRPFASFYGYNIAGQVARSYQRIDGADYGFTNYVYNRADQHTQSTYPSGRVVTTAYDGAGRTASVSTTANTMLSSAITYSPGGGLTSETLGIGNLIHSVSYNSRFQPTSIRLGFGGTGSVFELQYRYGTLINPNDPDAAIDATKNNGNIARTRLFFDSYEQYQQSYRYDALNRVQDYYLYLTGDPQPYLLEAYQYDRFGNRGMDNSVSTSWGPPLSYFNAANNRITGPGYQFDGRGNMTAEPIPGGTTIAKRYTYNAENKILTFNTGVNTYDYDGDGRRVKFKDSFNRTTRMVYDAAGQLIAEYDAANGSLKKEYVYRGGQLLATIEPGNGVKIGTPDHLGSMREWTDLSGNLIVDGTHDYTPFGTDLYYGEQRDGQRQQFAGKERDNETGLDYFLARYYSNVQGRFTSVDPEGAGSDPEDAQSWNGYAYARSNPVLLTDPDGRKYRICSADGKECYYHDDDFYNARRTGKSDGFTFSGSRDFFEGGEIRDKDGNVVATYQQISIDDPTREFIYAMRMSVGDPALVKRSFANVALGAVFFGGLRTNPNRNFSQIDRLSRAAAAPDRGGFTKAGRSLTKHGAGARPGNQKFPAPKGSPTQINRIAQEQVDDILSNPGTTVTYTSKGRFGPTIEYTAPDGRGLVFKANGEFLFFKE
jgi:RHS repeat-associated protein